MKITEAVENHMEQSPSMALLLAARPEAAELIKQAYRVGFADGALWQSITISNYANAGVKRDMLARHEGRPDHDLTTNVTPLRAGA